MPEQHRPGFSPNVPYGDAAENPRLSVSLKIGAEKRRDHSQPFHAGQEDFLKQSALFSRDLPARG